MVLFWILFPTFLLSHVLCCHDDWVLSPRLDRCYKLYTEFTMAWEDARMYCRRMNATLAGLTDREEQLFVNKTLLNEESVREVWLGAWNGLAESQWKWEDGSQLVVPSYRWMYDDSDEHQWFYCLAIFGARCIEGAGKLVHKPCHEKFPFICQREGHIPPNTLETSETPPTCVLRSLNEILSSEEQGMNVSVTVLVAMLGIFVVLSFIFIVLYIRQRHKSRPQSGLNVQAMPHMDGTEQPAYSCLDDRNLSPSNMYARLTSTENEVKTPQRPETGGHTWKNSAYIDVRTPNNFQMWTVE